MRLALRPDIQRYIDEQIKRGRFATPEAVIEAAIVDMRDGSTIEPDDETVAAINEGESQADRGEGIDFDNFKAGWRKRISGG